MADVRLRPLREDEWSDWRAWAITEYAGDVARNEGITPERARTQATKELDQDLLPDGIRTTGHRILVAEDMDISRIALNVFGDNERARHLYETGGYTEMARQMAKDLDT